MDEKQQNKRRKNNIDRGNLMVINDYGIKFWSDNNFMIEDGKVKLNYANKPAIIDLIKLIQKDGHKGPTVLRFPHLIEKQIKKLFETFNTSIDEYSYTGTFNAVFPLKVNQFPYFLFPLIEYGKQFNYGLEAGSKAELILAMAFNHPSSPITVNGFKDKEMITLGFIAKSMGYDITLTIEGLNELETIIKVYKESNLPCPNVGLRLRLHSSGSGIWAKSGGIDSKFGLSSTEILEAYQMLKDVDLISCLTMLHFHIGSAMNTINPLKKALRESGHLYVALRHLGAENLKNINIGGGLAIEYSQFEQTRFYSLQEFSNDVVFILKEIANKKNVEEPNIFTESGRFISAPSSMLVAPVVELFSAEFDKNHLRHKDNHPQIIKELQDLYNDMKKTNAIEFMHDSLEHLESVLTLFDLGYMDLEDRSNAEVLTQLIIKKAIDLLDFDNVVELRRIEEKIQEKYLLNFSIFQSLPDFWGIDQEFPVMPLTHLDKQPTRSACLWDITCDSDGEIAFDNKKPLYLHDIDLNKEEYYLGFFLVGAYQDILGMKHNLFSHPTELNVVFRNDEMVFENLLESQKIIDILEDLDYDTDYIERILKDKIFRSEANDITKMKLFETMKRALNDSCYLKTLEV